MKGLNKIGLIFVIFLVAISLVEAVQVNKIDEKKYNVVEDRIDNGYFSKFTELNGLKVDFDNWEEENGKTAVIGAYKDERSINGTSAGLRWIENGFGDDVSLTQQVNLTDVDAIGLDVYGDINAYRSKISLLVGGEKQGNFIISPKDSTLYRNLGVVLEEDFEGEKRITIKWKQISEDNTGNSGIDNVKALSLKAGEKASNNSISVKNESEKVKEKPEQSNAFIGIDPDTTSIPKSVEKGEEFMVNTNLSNQGDTPGTASISISILDFEDQELNKKEYENLSVDDSRKLQSDIEMPDSGDDSGCRIVEVSCEDCKGLSSYSEIIYAHEKSETEQEIESGSNSCNDEGERTIIFKELEYNRQKDEIIAVVKNKAEDDATISLDHKLVDSAVNNWESMAKASYDVSLKAGETKTIRKSIDQVFEDAGANRDTIDSTEWLRTHISCSGGTICEYRPRTPGIFSSRPKIVKDSGDGEKIIEKRSGWYTSETFKTVPYDPLTEPDSFKMWVDAQKYTAKDGKWYIGDFSEDKERIAPPQVRAGSKIYLKSDPAAAPGSTEFEFSGTDDIYDSVYNYRGAGHAVPRIKKKRISDHVVIEASEGGGTGTETITYNWGSGSFSVNIIPRECPSSNKVWNGNECVGHSNVIHTLNIPLWFKQYDLGYSIRHFETSWRRFAKLSPLQEEYEDDKEGRGIITHNIEPKRNINGILLENPDLKKEKSESLDAVKMVKNRLKSSYKDIDKAGGIVKGSIGGGLADVNSFVADFSKRHDTSKDYRSDKGVFIHEVGHTYGLSHTRGNSPENKGIAEKDRCDMGQIAGTKDVVGNLKGKLRGYLGDPLTGSFNDDDGEQAGFMNYCRPFKYFSGSPQDESNENHDEYGKLKRKFDRKGLIGSKSLLQKTPAGNFIRYANNLANAYIPDGVPGPHYISDFAVSMADGQSPKEITDERVREVRDFYGDRIDNIEDTGEAVWNGVENGGGAALDATCGVPGISNICKAVDGGGGDGSSDNDDGSDDNDGVGEKIVDTVCSTPLPC